MKVGINATCLNDRPSGAKQRFLGIYKSLVRQLNDFEFVVYEPADCRVSKWFTGFDNVIGRPTIVPSTGRWNKQLSAQFYWRLAFMHETFDVFEGMHLPFFRPRRGFNVLTIHDVRDLKPETASMNIGIYRHVLRKALSKADHVITVSAAMREEILAFYPHTPVSVIYNGLNPAFLASPVAVDCEEFAARYGLPAHFMLAVGHLEKRKNYSNLVNAISLLQRRGIDCPLVIIGNDSGERPALETLIASLNLAGQVHLLTGLSDEEVRCAYRACHLFVFPSAYEGFGIPILEAMASGRPMALSDLPVFREITEGQVVYFPHDDVEAMADSIERALSSNTLRAQMIQYGFGRVADFSFDRLASELATLYAKR